MHVEHPLTEQIARGPSSATWGADIYPHLQQTELQVTITLRLTSALVATKALVHDARLSCSVVLEQPSALGWHADTKSLERGPQIGKHGGG